MGITAPLAEMIIFEHKWRRISGRVLSLGRQTILFGPDTLSNILNKYGFEMRDIDINFDNSTVQAKIDRAESYITDDTFWRSLGVEQFDVMDISNYEGANIIHDLCQPIPSDFEERYDFIFNGSVLDNLFDPAAAMRNMTRMLKTDGRLATAEMASNLAFEYLIYSPDWFFDYYLCNNFGDCKTYICGFDNLEQLIYGPWKVYSFNPKSDGTSVSVKSLGHSQSVVVVFAEKAKESTWQRNPVQWCYRSSGDMKAYLDWAHRFTKSQRPYFGFKDQTTGSKKREGFVYCGEIDSNIASKLKA